MLNNLQQVQLKKQANMIPSSAINAKGARLAIKTAKSTYTGMEYA